MMNIILVIILLGLMIYVGGGRGVKMFISLLINFAILMLTFYLIAFGFNPVVVAVIGCLVIAYVMLYFVNGHNVKTENAFKAVVIVLIILSILIYVITKVSNIAGFGYESEEEINMFSYNVNLDFVKVTMALIIIGLIGATVDVAMSISSSLYELKENNKNISKEELFRAGLNMGKDILGTTTNTLFFAFLGEFMTLLIYFKTAKYSFLTILNNKTFCQEFIQIMFSAIGCILVIPITTYISSRSLAKKKDK